MRLLLALLAETRATAYALAVAWLLDTAATLLDLLNPDPAAERNPAAMAGYLNHFIDLPFPDLAGTDPTGRPLVWVKIRNPRLIPGQDLLGAAGKVRFTEDGKPVDADTSVAAEETYKTFAKLILAGNVWDATWTPTSFDTDEEQEPPLLPMPPTPADVARYPIAILNAIGKELSKANPR